MKQLFNRTFLICKQNNNTHVLFEFLLAISLSEASFNTSCWMSPFLQVTDANCAWPFACCTPLSLRLPVITAGHQLLIVTLSMKYS